MSTDNTDPKNESDSDELDRYHSGEQDENVILTKRMKMKTTHWKLMSMTKFVSLSNRQEKLLQKQVKYLIISFMVTVSTTLVYGIMSPKLKKYLKHLIIKNQMIKMIARMMKMMTHLIPNLKVILQRPLKKF